MVLLRKIKGLCNKKHKPFCFFLVGEMGGLGELGELGKAED